MSRVTTAAAEEETRQNAPGSDLKQWSVVPGWYRSRPSGWRRSYTARAPKLDLPFVGLAVLEVR